MGTIQAQVEFKFKPHLLADGIPRQQHQAMLTKKQVSPVGRVIKDALRRLGKNQGWLAERCDVSNQAVTNWIRDGEVSREKAVLAAKALQVPVGALISDESPLAGILGEAILSLDGPEAKTTLDFLLFNLRSAGAMYDGERRKRYADMIESIRNDITKRGHHPDA